MIFFSLCVLIVFILCLNNNNNNNNIDNSHLLLNDEYPSERNRCYSKRGFSIIKPNGWETSSINDIFNDDVLDNGYYLLSSRKRKPHSIVISRQSLEKIANNSVKSIVCDYLQNTIKLPDCDSKILQFQDKEAYLFKKIYVDGNMNKQSYFCIAFTKDKYLYLIQIVIIGNCPEIPAGILRFINTFQSDRHTNTFKHNNCL
jgi:hypothetical protein